jgi:hypothetical protein
MHEMSLAGGILKVMDDAAAREPFQRVQRLTLEAGALAGVEVRAPVTCTSAPAPAKVSVPGMSQARAIRLETDILGANGRIAAQNRAQFAAHGVTALNFVSSPGSGKTTLLCATIEALRGALRRCRCR